MSLLYLHILYSNIVVYSIFPFLSDVAGKHSRISMMMGGNSTLHQNQLASQTSRQTLTYTQHEVTQRSPYRLPTQTKHRPRVCSIVSHTLPGLPGLPGRSLVLDRHTRRRDGNGTEWNLIRCDSMPPSKCNLIYFENKLCLLKRRARHICKRLETGCGELKYPS